MSRITPAFLAAVAAGNLADAIAASTPGGVEAQEARGQRLLCSANALPKELRGTTREQLEALGFKFGHDIDEIFVACDFPPGWKLVPTEHSMHNELLDDKGRIRGTVFYKAAFYDRRSDLYMKPRYWVDVYRKGSSDDRRAVVVVDQDIPIKEIREWRYPPDDYKELVAIEIEAKNWLAKHYPDYENPHAYWD